MKCRPRMDRGGRQIKPGHSNVIEMPKKIITVLPCNRARMAHEWRNGKFLSDISKQYQTPIRQAEAIVRDELFGYKKAA
jgi:hypothetical protein